MGQERKLDRMKLDDMKKVRVESSLEQNMAFMKKQLCLDKNFDIVYRVVQLGDRKGALYFIDGFTKDEILEKIIEFMMKQGAEGLDVYKRQALGDRHGEARSYSTPAL